MPETYAHIINELKPDYDLVSYCVANDLEYEGVPTIFTVAARNLCERVRKAVAGDPNEWYVLDRDGEEVHIGDEVDNGYSENEVRGFCIRNGRKTVEHEDGFDFATSVRHPDRETRENIIMDLACDLLSINDEEFDEMALANDYVNRILALKDQR